MSENGEIYTAGKNFTLPPAVTALTNSTSAHFTKKVNLLIVFRFISSEVPIRFGYSGNVNKILHDPKSQGFESSHSQSQFLYRQSVKVSLMIAGSQL